MGSRWVPCWMQMSWGHFSSCRGERPLLGVECTSIKFQGLSAKTDPPKTQLKSAVPAKYTTSDKFHCGEFSVAFVLCCVWSHFGSRPQEVPNPVRRENLHIAITVDIFLKILNQVTNSEPGYGPWFLFTNLKIDFNLVLLVKINTYLYTLISRLVLIASFRKLLF